MTTSTDNSLRVTRDDRGVVVTVDGELSLPGSSRLGAVLGDLIDGQGNLAVAVDLRHATSVDTAAVGVFSVAANLARRHGGTLSVLWPGGDATTVDAPAGAERHRHLVEFYETEASLADSVRQYLEPAFREDEAVIVVATSAHRRLFEAALVEAGVDVEGARTDDRYLDVDAEAMLSEFMVEGAPDATRFHGHVGGLVTDAAATGRPVRIYGEMVAVLWGEGNTAAAVALEDLWNDLACSEPFSLLCAYPTTSFHTATTGLFRTICEQHSVFVPEAHG